MGTLPRRDTGGAVGDEPSPGEIIRLFTALQEEDIRYLIAGMSAAVLQGVSVTTFDTDIWVDLPVRAYMRVINICHRMSAQILAPTAVILKDGTEINFLYQVTGLAPFGKEYPQAKIVTWQGKRVRVLPLPRLIKSKEAIRRPKDLVHIAYLKTAVRLSKATK